MLDILKSPITRIAAVIVAVLLIAVGVLSWQLKDSLKANGTLTAQLDTATQANVTNAQHYEAELAQAKQNADIANAQRALADQRNQSLQETLDAIHHSPASDRGAVSPVVRHTVDQLWDSPPHNP